MVFASSSRVTRLAPSPTGALHLGNARTFLINWAIARQNAWRIVMRIEDLDGPRVKPGAMEQAGEDLHWLGIDWDDPPAGAAYTQRADPSPYYEALQMLARAGLIYPCACTRSQIENAQSAPHVDEHELRYPGLCRPAAAEPCDFTPLPNATPPASSMGPAAWRLRVPDEEIEYHDAIQGPQRFNIQKQVGDFLVATKTGLPAYQLAVVVDDARQGVTDIIRGDDLLSSAARQLLIYRYLNLTPLPTYWHLPLVYGPDGRRLAKRHGDSRLASYRAQGVPVERIIGLLAYWSGVTGQRQPLNTRAFVQEFSLERLPRGPVTMKPDDHAWLLNH